MDMMMNAMVRSMPKEDREKMMLELMPQMMNQADLNVLMPNMASELGKMITLYGAYSLISQIVSDPVLKKEFGGAVKTIHEKMPEMMPMMMPMMMPVMKELMPKMMGVMMPMMSGMMKEMAEKQECIMADAVDKDPKMKVMMGEMMLSMCPDMAGKVIPEEKAAEFVKHMRQTVLTDRGLSPAQE